MAEILATLLWRHPLCWTPPVARRITLPPTILPRSLDVAQFKATMDQMLETLRTTEPASGHDRVLCSLSEYEEAQERRAHGIPLHKEVIQWFNSITSELGLTPLATLGKK